MINPKMNMENYIIGKFNKRASVASAAILEEPGRRYNPLFLFSKPGLGRTHLLHAIGNEFIKKNPSAKVIYVSAEVFVNELCESLRDNKMGWFRSKYRTVDLLLLDDIQFIDRKRRTQEELLYTIEELLRNNSQIVVASDRTPHKMVDLHEGLSSLLKGSMIVSIDQPGVDERVAILSGIASDLGVEVNSEDAEETIRYISENIKTNIMELAGALKREIAFAELEERNISITGAKKLLQEECSIETNEIYNKNHIQNMEESIININIDRDNVARSNRVWTKDQQLFVSVEELSELIQGISKARRGRPIDNVIEELADVYIVMEIVKDQFNISDEAVDKVVQYKQQRLEEKMDNLYLTDENSKEKTQNDGSAPWIIDVDTTQGSRQPINVRHISNIHADINTNDDGEISVVLHTSVVTHEGDSNLDIEGNSIYRILAKLSRFTDFDITQAVEDLFFDGPKSIRSDYNFMTLYKAMSLDTRERLFPDGMK